VHHADYVEKPPPLGENRLGDGELLRQPFVLDLSALITMWQAAGQIAARAGNRALVQHSHNSTGQEAYARDVQRVLVT
jgi:hypothetical protein